MPRKELHKTLVANVPIFDWKLVRDEAIRRKIPVTQLVYEWVRPHVDELRAQKETSDAP